MKGIMTEFEVRVRNDGHVDMFHYRARNHAHAAELGKKHGIVISVRKADLFKMLGDSGKLKLEEPQQKTAIGLDTIGMMMPKKESWKNKRMERRNNLQRDKITIDKL